MFAEALQLDLSLRVGSARLEIPGGDIKRFEIDLSMHGFEAEVEFWVQLEVEQDLVFPLVTGQDPIEARLSVKGTVNLPTPEPDPLVVQGLVRQRALAERIVERVKDAPILFRRYRLRFSDNARALWGQHFPSALFADSDMAEVLKSHAAAGIVLDLDWPALTEVQEQIFFGLGAPGGGASFYDFVVGWVRDRGGTLSYDSRANTYRLAASKPEAGVPALLDPTEIERVEVVIPPPPRCDARVQNAVASAPTQEVADQQHKVAGVRRDTLLRTPLAARATARKDLEAARLAATDHELDVHFRMFPKVTFRAWSDVALDGYHGGHHVGRAYRVRRLLMSGGALDPAPETDRGRPKTQYELDLRARLELAAAPHPDHLEVRAPRYPVIVGGTIVSETGEEGEKTYQVYQDAASRDVYRVFVPLWNKTIRAPFEPLLMPGHFYFPAFRDQPVLLKLWLDRAEIIRFLDWGADVRLDQASQGDHVLFGKSLASQTSLAHAYVDAKPVLTIKRTSSGDEASDTQLIELREGALAMVVQEEAAVKAAEPKHSVKPRVEAARAELTTETQAAVSDVSGGFAAASAGVSAKLGDAIGETRSALDDMEDAISGRVDEVRAEVTAALGELGEQTAALEAALEALAADLESEMTL